MILNVNDERQIEAPTLADLDQAIRGLGADQYIILSKDAEQYMQTYLNEDGSWDLEYREGSAEDHYAADGQIDTETVISTFQVYAEDGDFRSEVLWFRLELPEYADDDLINGLDPDSLGIDGELDWQEDIDASQRMPELELQGEIYQRVPHGSESYHEAEIFSNCEDCNVLPKQFHVLGCEQEECPLCQGFLMECKCLELDTDDGVDNLDADDLSEQGR